MKDISQALVVLQEKYDCLKLEQLSDHHMKPLLYKMKEESKDYPLAVEDLLVVVGLGLKYWRGDDLQANKVFTNFVKSLKLAGWDNKRLYDFWHNECGAEGTRDDYLLLLVHGYVRGYKFANKYKFKAKPAGLPYMYKSLVTINKELDIDICLNTLDQIKEIRFNDCTKLPKDFQEIFLPVQGRWVNFLAHGKGAICDNYWEMLEHNYYVYKTDEEEKAFSPSVAKQDKMVSGIIGHPKNQRHELLDYIRRECLPHHPLTSNDDGTARTDQQMREDPFVPWEEKLSLPNMLFWFWPSLQNDPRYHIIDPATGEEGEDFDDELYYFAQLLPINMMVGVLLRNLYPDDSEAHTKACSMVVSEANNIGKSSLFKALLYPLEHLYQENVLLKDGDPSKEIESTVGKIFGEIPELAAIETISPEYFKTAISRDTYRGVRLAFGREKENFKRTCSFVITANKTAFLPNDESVFTRIISVDVPASLTIEKDRNKLDKLKDGMSKRLWAEAYWIAMHFDDIKRMRRNYRDFSLTQLVYDPEPTPWVEDRMKNMNAGLLKGTRHNVKVKEFLGTLANPDDMFALADVYKYCGVLDEHAFQAKFVKRAVEMYCSPFRGRINVGSEERYKGMYKIKPEYQTTNFKNIAESETKKPSSNYETEPPF